MSSLGIFDGLGMSEDQQKKAEGDFLETTVMSEFFSWQNRRQQMKEVMGIKEATDESPF